jgi:Ser/Thr protein kinase RdoA (MazF antagonist)
MNVAFRVPSEHQTMPVAAARLIQLLAGNGVADVIQRAAETLGLAAQDAVQANALRLHLRTDGSCVIDVACGSSDKQLFIEVATGDVQDLRANIQRRHEKQQVRLGLKTSLHVHADATCIVRLKGEDEWIDGLPALRAQDSADVKILAHRLNRRAVLRLTRADGAPVIVKAYKKGSQKAQAAERLHGLLTNTAFGGTSPVRVPKVLSHGADWPGYAMEQVSGEAIADLSGSTRQQGLRLAGQALGRLHRLPLRLEVGHTLEEEFTVLRCWVDLTSRLSPRRSETLHLARAHVENLLAATDAEATECIVHRDFHEGQVLVSGGTATLIDFDTVCNGEPAQDIGNFLAHLDYASLRSGIDVADEAGVFLDAYTAANAPVSASRIRAHRAATLLRLSCIHVLPQSNCAAAEVLAERALSL